MMIVCWVAGADERSAVTGAGAAHQKPWHSREREEFGRAQRHRVSTSNLFLLSFYLL